MLQYDKIYQSLKKVSAEWHASNLDWQFIYYYLRFYTDGTVVFSSSPQEREEVDKWLSKSLKDKETGSFIIEKKNRIKINIPVAIGYITFEGIIKPNSLILNTCNNKINKSSWDYFSI